MNTSCLINVAKVPVNVTNGRNVFPCHLELVSDGGFKKAILNLLTD